MAIITLVTVLGPASLPKGGRAVVVDVLRLDTTLIGKVVHPSQHAVVDTTGASDDVTAVKAAYPSAQVFASMDARRPTIEQLLIDAGLRDRQGDGKLALSARAVRVDAGLEAR